MQYSRADVRQQLAELGFNDVTEEILDSFMLKLQQRIQQSQSQSHSNITADTTHNTDTTTALPSHLQRYNDIITPSNTDDRHSESKQSYYEHGKLQRPRTAHASQRPDNTQPSIQPTATDFAYLSNRYGTDDEIYKNTGHIHSQFNIDSNSVKYTKQHRPHTAHYTQRHTHHMHDTDNIDDVENEYSDNEHEYEPSYQPHTKATKMLLPYTQTRRTDRVNRWQQYQNAWQHDRFLKTQSTRKH